MIDEIKKRYELFSDSLISKISYERTTEKDGKIEIIIRSMNALNNYQFELVKLIITNVIEFRLIEKHPFSSLIINSALLIKENDFIIIDFYPDIYKDCLKINLESDFIIKAEKICYKVL